MEINIDQQRFLWTAKEGLYLSPYQALKLGLAELKAGLPGEKELPLHLPPL